MVTMVTMNDFTDEMGVALAEALTVNKTLRRMLIMVTCLRPSHQATLGAHVYEAFGAMLRVNTSLVLELPPFDDAGGDERRADSHNQMLIEQELNKVGRGRLLLSSQTPRKKWVNALIELNSTSTGRRTGRGPDGETPEFKVSCLYSLLQLNPSICLLKLDGTCKQSVDYKRRYTRW
jgi:hypothetical protein